MLTSNLKKGVIVAPGTLDALEEGLKQIRLKEGFIDFSDDESSPFSWGSALTIDSELPQAKYIDEERVISDHKNRMQQGKAAVRALNAMARLIGRQMTKANAKMQLLMLSHGIQELPDEILARIVMLEGRQARGPRVEELRLVCRRFNDIIQSHAFIWSFVRSSMNPKRVAEQLQRSGSAGLFVVLHYSGFSFDNFIDAILPHSARWEEIQDRDHPGENLGNGQTLPSVYDKLKNLHLPRLNTLTITSSSSHDIVRSVYRTWTTPRLIQLTFYAKFLCYASALSAWLSSLTSLRTLCLYFDELTVIAYTYTPGESMRIKLPFLRELEVNIRFPVNRSGGQVGEGSQSVYQLLASFDTPQLDRLMVTLEDDNPSGNYTQRFLQFFIPDVASVRHFEFHNKKGRLYIDEKVLNPMFTHLWRCEYATISGIGLHDHTSCDLPTNHTPHVPFALRSLHLRDCEVMVDSLRLSLKALSDQAIFPHFKTLILTRCTNIDLESLKGTPGWKYIVWQRSIDD